MGAEFSLLALKKFQFLDFWIRDAQLCLQTIICVRMYVYIYFKCVHLYACYSYVTEGIAVTELCV